MIKKVVLFLIVILLTTFTYTYAQFNFPKYEGYVNDFENILDNDEALEQLLTQFEKDTSVEIVIVTTPDFQGSTIEDYSSKLFEAWGIGKKDVDNGLLIVVSSSQKQSRFEVGYGLEGILPDSLTGRIQDEYMIPYFKEGNYSKGISEGVLATIGIVQKDPSVISKLNTTNDYKNISVDSIAFIILFIIYVMAATKSWWLGGIIGFVVGVYFAFRNNIFYIPIITTPIGLLFDFLISRSAIGRFLIRSAISSVGFTSHRSGGSGITYGGGSSGGGGSSRSW